MKLDQKDPTGFAPTTNYRKNDHEWEKTNLRSREIVCLERSIIYKVLSNNSDRQSVAVLRFYCENVWETQGDASIGQVNWERLYNEVTGPTPTGLSQSRPRRDSEIVCPTVPAPKGFFLFGWPLFVGMYARTCKTAVKWLCFWPFMINLWSRCHKLPLELDFSMLLIASRPLRRLYKKREHTLLEWSKKESITT